VYVHGELELAGGVDGKPCRKLFRLSSNPGPHGLRLNSAIGGFHIMVRRAVEPQGSLARQ